MRNRVVLINPDLPQKPTQFNVPISLLYLGTWLSREGYNVNILDAYNHKIEIHRRLQEESWDGVLAVGLSVMTAQVGSAIEISKHIKSLSPNIPIIWGGVHPTLYPGQPISNHFVDFVVVGEGEITAAELLGVLGADSRDRISRLEAVNGIVYHDTSNRAAMTPDRSPMDINRLVCPKLGLLEDVRNTGDIRTMMKQVQKGLPLLTSRGCPHRCLFCINSITKQQYRFRRADLVIQDLEKLLNQGITEICFVDEDFLANKPRLIEILDKVEKRRLKFKWFGTARADYFGEKCINNKLLDRLKQSGCTQLGIGLESGSQRVLDMINKNITIKDSFDTARLLDKAGIDATFSFMFGLPDETAEEINATAKMIASITGLNNKFRILPNIYRPYAGSRLYDRCREFGMVEPETLEDWTDNPYMKGDTVDSKDYSLFPWIQYPIEKLLKLIFYCWMAGLRTKGPGLTELARRIGAWRLNHLCFALPIEMKLLDLFRRLNLERKMGRGKFN